MTPAVRDAAPTCAEPGSSGAALRLERCERSLACVRAPAARLRGWYGRRQPHDAKLYSAAQARSGNLLGCTGRCAASVGRQCSASGVQARIPTPGDSIISSIGMQKPLRGPAPACCVAPLTETSNSISCSACGRTAQHCTTRTCVDICMSGNSVRPHAERLPRALPPHCFPAVDNRTRWEQWCGADRRQGAQACRSALAAAAARAGTPAACAPAARPRCPERHPLPRRYYTECKLLLVGTYVSQWYMHFLV